MRITEVTWGGTFSTGGYENEKLSATAVVEKDEIAEGVLATLKEFVLTQASPNVQEVQSQKRQLLIEMDKLKRNVEQARQEWASVCEFLKAQGLKSDVSEFPVLKFLAAAPKLEVERTGFDYREELCDLGSAKRTDTED